MEFVELRCVLTEVSITYEVDKKFNVFGLASQRAAVRN